MKIALDIGHRGKPSRPNDRGAVGPDGEEVALCLTYWRHMDRALRLEGAEVLGPLSGEYRERIAAAAAWGARVFLQLHADAGGGHRSTVWYDARSRGGAGLAMDVQECAAVGVAVDDAAIWHIETHAAGPDTNGKPEDEGERVYSVLAPVYPVPRMVGILWEVGFVDGPVAHRRFVLDRAGPICGKVAAAIAAWGGEHP